MKKVSLPPVRLKWFLPALCGFLTVLSVHAAPVVLEAQEADDTTATYTLIESVLGSGTASEVPDDIHPEFGPHITRTWADALGKYVFNFFLHVTPDDDPTDPLLTDRQRIEIKTMSGSPAYVVATNRQTTAFRWWFKIDSGFQPSPSFTHIHQIKAVNDIANDSTPLITLTPRAGSPEKMQIMFAPSDAAGQSEIASANLSGFKGEWIEANEKIFNATNGTYEIVLKRVRDGSVLLSYTNNNIIMWRGGNSASINRPKWGLYRSLNDVSYLRDEVVQFADFSIAKNSDTFSNIAPSITMSPTNLTVVEGQDAAFSAEASGTAALKYQWRFNTSNSLSWATNATMTIGNVRSTNAGTYLVVVSNWYGAVTSTVATLTVNAATAPTITQQPQNVDAVSGMSLNFSVTVSGSDPFTYQWRKDGSPVSGGTNNPLSFINVDPISAGNYDVIVANVAGSVTSAVAILTVVAESNTVFSTAGGTNWVCPADVTSIRVQCWGGGGAGGSAKRTSGTTSQYGGGGAGGAYAKYTSYPVTPGNTYYINVGAGAANSATNDNTTVAGGDSWFNTNNAPSSIIIAKGGAGGESAIGSTTTTGYGVRGTGTTNGSAGTVVYAGGSGFTAVSSKAGGGGSSAGTATNGTSATSQTGATAPTGGGNGGTGPTTSPGVGGNGSAPGGGGAGARSSSTTLYAGGNGSVGKVVLTYAVAAPPVVTNQPASQSVKVGDTATFTVGISGAVPLTYRWWFNGSDLGATATNSTLVIANAQLSHAGNYKVVITNTYGAATSTVASLTVEAVATTLSLLSVDFESDTLNLKPTTSGAIVRPATSTVTNYVTVVSSSTNKAGTGQGVRFLDNSTNASTALEYNFVSNSASQISLVQASFNFSCITSNSGTTSYISIGLGAYSNGYSLSSSALRWNEFRLYQNNTLRITTNGGSAAGTYSLNPAGTSNTLVMFANDSTASMAYTFNGDQTLAADSVAYWLNGTKISTVLLDTEVLSTTNNFGKIGFGTSTGGTSMDYAFDNIQVWQILPPSTSSVSATASAPIGSGTGTGGLTVPQGSSITLTETPSGGTAPFTYAWKKVGSGTVLSTTNTCLIASPTNGAQYTCDVAATWDGVTNTSPVVTVTVVPLVSATAAKPTGNGSGTGGLTTYSQRTRMILTETPSGGTAPFTYAWKKVGSGTVLGTNSTLTISPLVNGDQYVCDVASTADGVTNTSPTATLTVTTSLNSNKVVLIKADDVRVINWYSPTWTNFIVASGNLGIKIGLGIIATNITDASASTWLRAKDATGEVEFWDHGWDHTQWDVVNGSTTTTVSEFEGSGLAYMRQHLANAQSNILASLGKPAIAFGTGYNGFDTNTAAVINETPALRLLFTRDLALAGSIVTSGVVMVDIISESGGTGKPDAALFKAAYPGGPTGPVSLQHHPANFDSTGTTQYMAIVEYLLTNGYAFLTPSEYVAAFAPNTAPSVSLTAPTNGATFTAPASITMTATAADTDGTVTNVDFYNGATLLGSDATSPYAFTWTNVAAGSYSLTARATDNDGAVSTSAVVTVTVASPVYTLTVNSGTGGGSYTNGRQVAVAAYAPASGKVFSQWTGDIQYLNNATYTNATVTMSTNAVTLTATYVDVYYPLTVNNGTGGGGTYTNGMRVAIAANAPASGKAFDHWIGDTQYVDNAGSLNTTVTMPAQAISLTATYVDVYYSLTINYGTGGGLTYVKEQQVAILANDPAVGKAFDKWTGDTQFVGNASSASTTVTMPSQDVVLTATYVDVYYPLTVNSGTGDGSYTNGRQVAISADAPASGKAFSQWTGDIQYVNNVTYTNALVTMSTNAVTLTATYSNLYYALTVNSGTGDGSYTNGQQVAIAADVVSGKTFLAWTGDTQAVASVSSSNTTVTMPAQAIALTATYVDTTYALTVTSGTGGGSYTNGQQVAIAADAPASGKIFDQWIGDTAYVVSSNSASTTVTMPAQAISLTATYKDAAVYHLLTANGAAGGSVSPSSTNVLAGNSATFAITASNYYRIASLTTNGTAVTGMSFDNNSTATNFIWSNVQTSGVLAATFTEQVATNSAASGANVPYRWMAGYGLTNSGATFDQAVAADQDGDGLTVWQEYIAGTDPTNGTSCLKATQNTRNTVSWSPVSGRVYSVYWSTNLVKGFTALNTNIPYTQSSYTNAAPDSRANYYQIKVRLQ